MNFIFLPTVKDADLRAERSVISDIVSHVQPLSIVVHFEGVTSGSDTSKG